MYYVYVLQSIKDKNLYTGYTNNLRRRIAEHNQGLSFSTSFRLPFKLIYYEAYLNRKDAMQREIWLKSGWGRNYLNRALANYLAGKF